MKYLPGHQISSFLGSAFNFLLFKHHYFIKLKRCLLKEITLTLMKSWFRGNPKCDRILGVPDLRISGFLAEASGGSAKSFKRPQESWGSNVSYGQESETQGGKGCKATQSQNQSPASYLPVPHCMETSYSCNPVGLFLFGASEHYALSECTWLWSLPSTWYF